MRFRRAALVIFLVATAACGSLLGIDDIEGPGSATPVPETGVPETGNDSAVPVVDAGFDAAVPETGPRAKTVFVTTATFNGGLNGPSGADEECAKEALDAGLEAGTWRAWLSVGSTNAIDRIEHTGPYKRVDDQIVVSEKSKLGKGMLEKTITITAHGKVSVGTTLAWTGTNLDGKKAEGTCQDWTSGANFNFGTMGDNNNTDAKWTHNGGRPNPPVPFPAGTWDCGQPGHLYCFER